jgi:(p)ppGpp synthase/HD superfamily hydrolase
MILSSHFREALVYACELHAEQVRKGSRVPYVAHLLGVASIALEYGAKEDEAIAALLHDAIEDQGGVSTKQEIQRRFGETVATIVDGCSDTDQTPKPPWRERKQAYIDHIPKASASVRLVSAADKLYNARSIVQDYRQVGEAIWERFTGGASGTLWYYRAIVDAFKRVEITPLVEELDRVVSQLEQLVSSESTDKTLEKTRLY